jgi:hypothetical protein
VFCADHDTTHQTRGHKQTNEEQSSLLIYTNETAPGSVFYVRPVETRHGHMFHDVVIGKRLKGIRNLLYVTRVCCFLWLHVR